LKGDFYVGDWLVQDHLNLISRGGDSKHLERKSIEVLIYLAQHCQEVSLKERIIQAVWPDTFVTDAVLTHAITELRKAFGDDSKNPRVIQTIPRRGYRLIVPVSEVESESRYRILQRLGQGAMGEVYLAEDRLLKRKVALKFVLQEKEQDEKWKRRLQKEALAAAALDHPFICKVYETGVLEGRPFIAMEYVPGQTLEEKLSGGCLSAAEALSIAIDIGQALEIAHDKGVVHRDLKPSNVVLTDQGHPKITDFGIAKQLPVEGDGVQDRTDTITGGVRASGTLPYMSPEQVKGRTADFRSDIFSLGIVLYEMLTGANPFRKQLAMETAAAIQTETPAPLSDHIDGIPDGLGHAVSRMLAKDPEKRYASSHELTATLAELWAAAMLAKDPDRRYSSTHDVRTDLERLVEDPDNSAAEIHTPATAPPTPQKGSSSSRLWIGLVAVAVVLVLALVLWNWDQGSPPEPVVDAGRKSIAVLPLENLSADPENEYFADGITEDITTELSKIGDLKVIARTSVMSFKGSDKSLREIARELGVATLLEGSVRKASERVRIVTQLVDVETGEHLWGESYDRDLTDIFEIQSDVAQQVAAALKVELSLAEKSQIEKIPTTNVQAYELYMMGRHFRHQETQTSLQKAVECFQQAIEADPNYALAYAGLAEAYLGLGGWSARDEWVDDAEQSARRALELDDSVPEAHVAMGMIRMGVYHDLPGAEAEFQQALKLNPRHVNANREYGMLLNRWLGRLDEALVYLKRAHELDPLHTSTNLTEGNRAAGAFDEAIENSRKIMELEPSSRMGPFTLGLGYLGLAEYEKADHWFNKALEIEPDEWILRCLAMSLLWQGKVNQAAEISERLLAQDVRVPPFLVTAGLILLRQGNEEKAQVYLEEALQLSPFAQTRPCVLRASTLLGYLLWEKDRAAAEKKLSQSLVSDGQERIVSGAESGHPDWLYNLAMVSAVRGEKAEAYQWLQRAIDRGWRYYDIASKDPIWADFHGNQHLRDDVGNAPHKLHNVPFPPPIIRHLTFAFAPIPPIRHLSFVICHLSFDT